MSNDQYIKPFPIDIQSYLLLKSGGKPCIRFAVPYDDINRIEMNSKKHGLCVLVKKFSTLYGKKCENPLYLAYFSLSRDMARKAYEAEKNKDRKMFGELLGYPECCVDAFIKNLANRDDCILNAYNNTSTYPRFYCNNLFVYESRMGHQQYLVFKKIKKTVLSLKKLFLIRHVPCSFDCKESIAMGRETLGLLKDHNPGSADEIVHALKRQVLYFDIFQFGVFDGILKGNELSYKKIIRDISLLDDSVLEKLRQGDRIRTEEERTLIMKGSETILEIHKKGQLLDFR